MPTRRLPATIPHMDFMGLGGLGVGSPDPISMGVSAGVSLASVALSSWLQDKKQNGQYKTYTTTIVNQLEPLLNANKNSYLAGPGTCADQAAALSAFDSAWAWLQSTQACGNPQLGTPGQNCINDRAPGGQWDWTAMYRTPITNDPRAVCVTAADASEQAAVANLFAKISGSNVQTEAGSYTSGTIGSGSSGTTASSVLGSDPLGLGTVAGIPMTYLLLGGLLLVVVVAG